jgi:hypothetical protein
LLIEEKIMKYAVAIMTGVLVLFAVAPAGPLENVLEQIEVKEAQLIDLEMDLSVGEYIVVPTDTTDGVVAIIEGRYDADKFAYDLIFEEEARRADLYFSSESLRKRLSDWDSEDNHWQISLVPGFEYLLTVDIGAAEAEIDLGGLSISELDLDIGAADARIEFTTPNKSTLRFFRVDAGACDLDMRQLGNARFEHLEFDGGVGDFYLDFSGEFDYEASVDINVGLGSIDIILPDDIGVRIEADDNWLSSIDLPRRHFDRVDNDVYETENFADAVGRLTIFLEVGLGAADIEIR